MSEPASGAAGSGAADWASYTPGDFLMFAPRTYWRLFELHHEAWFPLHLLFLAAGVAALAGLALRLRRAAGAGALLIAVACGWVAQTFVIDRYVPIFWAAQGLAWLLLLAGLGLAVAAGELGARRRGWPRHAALLLLAFALFVHPLLAPLAGRPWQQEEMFGMAHDPTALAVLAWVAGTTASGAVGRWGRRVAGVAAAAACAFSAATLAVMGSWQALVPAAALLLFALIARTERTPLPAPPA